MHAPIPTPFDILDPPAGPIVPPPTTWLITALLILVVLSLRAIIVRRPKAPSVAGLISSLIDEFKHTAIHPQVELTVERLVRLGKRILSPYMACELDSLSFSEMRTLATSLASSPEDRLKSAASILNLLAELEEITYAPEANRSQVSTLISKLESCLAEHVRRHQPL